MKLHSCAILPLLGSLLAAADQHVIKDNGPVCNRKDDGPVCNETLLSCHWDGADVDSCCSPTNGLVVLTLQWDENVGPKDDFTIHGLWPDTCSGGRTPPGGCDGTRVSYQIGSIIRSKNRSLYEKLRTIWPSDPKFGHDENCGTCVSTLDPKCYGDTYEKYQDVVDYFQKTADLHAKYDVFGALNLAGVSPGRQYETSTMMDALINDNGFGKKVGIYCDDSGKLSDIRLYFYVQGRDTYVLVDADDVPGSRSPYAAIATCKWVDEVVKDAPYYMQVEVLKEYDVDYCVHGDDITTMADGTDCYRAVKDAGQGMQAHASKLTASVLQRNPSKRTGVSQFLPTSKRIVQFSDRREPKPINRIVYVDDTFDLFTSRAKALGDFLIAGIHDDPTVNAIKGSSFPVMNLHERALSVLACRYVDEVILGAPCSCTAEILDNKEYQHCRQHDPYKLIKERCINQVVENPKSTLTTDDIIDRVIDATKYEERQRCKTGKAALEKEAEDQARASQ
ncbi:ribonuclease T2-like protein [Gongronella butleri]|nr:ribonuclease T2-like protein [Gongronella butleri]